VPKLTPTNALTLSGTNDDGSRYSVDLTWQSVKEFASGSTMDVVWVVKAVNTSSAPCSDLTSIMTQDWVSSGQAGDAGTTESTAAMDYEYGGLDSSGLPDFPETLPAGATATGYWDANVGTHAAGYVTAEYGYDSANTFQMEYPALGW
jgi:hypothetical protein